MKKNLIPFATLLFGALLFQSCQKEEETITKTTTVTQSRTYTTYEGLLEFDWIRFTGPPDSIIVLDSYHYFQKRTLDVYLDTILNQYYFETDLIDIYRDGDYMVPVYFDSNGSAVYDEVTGPVQGGYSREIHIKANRVGDSIWYYERELFANQEYQTNAVSEGYLH